MPLQRDFRLSGFVFLRPGRLLTWSSVLGVHLHSALSCFTQDFDYSVTCARLEPGTFYEGLAASKP